MVNMTYYGAKDLASAFRTVRDNTIKIAEDIGEEDYGFRATPENRSIEETLMHIAGRLRIGRITWPGIRRVWPAESHGIAISGRKCRAASGR